MCVQPHWPECATVAAFVLWPQLHTAMRQKYRAAARKLLYGNAVTRARFLGKEQLAREASESKDYAPELRRYLLGLFFSGNLFFN